MESDVVAGKETERTKPAGARRGATRRGERDESEGERRGRRDFDEKDRRVGGKGNAIVGAREKKTVQRGGKLRAGRRWRKKRRRTKRRSGREERRAEKVRTIRRFSASGTSRGVKGEKG